jgi:hypothetical protein
LGGLHIICVILAIKIQFDQNDFPHFCTTKTVNVTWFF